MLRSLSDVIHRYDAVLLDQFGVLHDGETAIDGSINAVNQIKGLGIPVLILSNTSKRKRYVIDQLGSFDPFILITFNLTMKLPFFLCII